MWVTLYRAMSREEFETLRSEGFEATFRRRWKYFTMNPEYIGIVMHEANYGGGVKGKYEVPVRFEFLFKYGLDELARIGVVKVFCERGYTTVAMRVAVVGYIENMKWSVMDSVPIPKPLYTWVSKSGRVVMVFSERVVRKGKVTLPKHLK